MSDPSESAQPSESALSENGCSMTVDPKEILRIFVPSEGQSPHHAASGFVDIPNFSVFYNKHMEIAQNTAHKLSEYPVKDMIGILSDMKRRYPNSCYVDYLSRTTLVKHDMTKCLIPPPPSQILPYSFHTKEELNNALTKSCTVEESTTPAKVLASPISRDPESKLDWWREDLSLSEHHCNWHAYYPFYYSSTPLNLKVAKARREGELFAYMHQQMIARYNCERLAAGLALVEPFGPSVGWATPLQQGYNGDIKKYSFRPSLLKIQDVTYFQSAKIYTSEMRNHEIRLFNSIARGFFEGADGRHIELTMHELGSAVESSGASPNHSFYGNIHNNGHLVIASMSDPDGRYGIKPGPMVDQYTAARDPAFFRWHKFVDNFFEALRIREAHKLDDLRMDGIEVLSIKAITDPLKDGSQPPDNMLYTKMEKKTLDIYITPSAGESPKINKTPITQLVLTHFPFQYEIEVWNKSSEEADLVFRVFLAPETSVIDLEGRRNSFIEMDRFVEKIEGGKTTISRKSSDSTVIMIPGPRVEDFETYKADDYKGYCGCGWPKNLMLPRGTPAGMNASLFVLVTDWAKDGNEPDLQRSAAYCGKKNFKYPDKRPMGFPFDRPIDLKHNANAPEGATLEDLVKDVPNSAKVDVVIKDLSGGDFE